VGDLPHGVSKLRNRVIGRVFQALGLIEQVGQRHPADDGRLSRRVTVDADRTSEALGAFLS
jgi:hypothetical protein